jgi:hypothetical protein
MSVHPLRVAACALLPVLAAWSSAGAQTPPASPAPTAPASAGFAAHAHANVTVVVQGATYTGSAQLGVAQRAGLTRVDVLSLRSDSFPVPPITVTVVIDRRANTLTAWSDATKLYRVQPFVPAPARSATPRPRATSRPTATPSPAVRGTSPFAKLDVLEVSLKLTGHTTTAGLPTTGLAFDLQVRNKGEQATSHVAATAQIADDYIAFPVTLDLSLEPGAAPFGAKLSYAVDDLTNTVPPPSRFAIPAGYTEASSLMSVIFPRRASPVPSPARAASPGPTRAP